jgi:hypothetical protein
MNGTYNNPANGTVEPPITPTIPADLPPIPPYESLAQDEKLFLYDLRRYKATRDPKDAATLVEHMIEAAGEKYGLPADESESEPESALEPDKQESEPEPEKLWFGSVTMEPKALPHVNDAAIIVGLLVGEQVIDFTEGDPAEAGDKFCAAVDVIASCLARATRGLYMTAPYHNVTDHDAFEAKQGQAVNRD